MARKRAVAEAVQVADEATMRPVRLELKADLHRLLRLLSADADVSMASYARDVLARHIKDEAKRKGIKG